MDDALRWLNELRPLWEAVRHVNPWAAAVTAALIAAWLEQRRAARRAPPFTTDHEGAAIAAKPGRPRP